MAITRRIVAFGITLVSSSVVLACRDQSPSPTAPAPDQAVAAAARLTFDQVSAGATHVCGTATDGRAWCWGNDAGGRLGDGDAALPQCGDSPCAKRPVAVAGGLRFRHVSAGFDFSCGVTTDDRIWCWGGNENGQLGNGTASPSTTPVEIAGNRRWRQVRAGDNSACGIAMSGAAFCWGLNNEGELGNGSTTLSRVPVAVVGGHQFTQLTVGAEHVCGVATDGRGWCWGVNQRGELGDGSTTGRLTPVEISGNLRFGQIDAGPLHTCGVTTAGKGYCWGFGNQGDGKPASLQLTPVAIEGHRKFDNVSTIANTSCAVTVAGVGFCWGVNGGAIGNGKTFNVKQPVRVAGDLSFKAISVGGNNTPFGCGVATDGRAWCWGSNDFGNLGDGSTTRRLVPTLVAAP